ncbi:MAG: ATP-binding protein [Solirubrobacteraceae bacterium]
MSAYRTRIADRLLANALAALGAVVVEGPKACGKTETARCLAASEVLLDLDPEAIEAAAIDPRLILGGAIPRLIDEWQRQPRVWDAVRREVDNRKAPGQFILTGSATPPDEASRHSGAGRMAILQMRPMTLYEQGFSPGQISLSELLTGHEPPAGKAPLTLAEYAERIAIGGWPGLLGASRAQAEQFIEGYLGVIIERDIDLISGARRDPHLVRRFLEAYAQLTAHPATLSTIVSRATDEGARAPSRWSAAPYLDALRRLMIVDEIDAWSPELRSRTRLMSTPKRHLVDPSLAAALLNANPDRLLGELRTLGFLFESLVTRDLRVYAMANDASLFHYRERGGDLEVDLIVERNDGAWIAAEVKLGGELIDQAASSLNKLATRRAQRPPAALMIVTATEYAYQRPDGILVAPLSLLGP